MKFRTAIHFGRQIAGSLMLTVLAVPAWGQQPETQVSSRQRHQAAPQKTAETSANSQTAAASFNFSSPLTEPAGEALTEPVVTHLSSTRRGMLQPMQAIETQPPPEMQPPKKQRAKNQAEQDPSVVPQRVNSPMKLPKLADPEQFKIQNAKSNGPWFNLQDDQTIGLSENQQTGKTTKPRQGEEGSLLRSLPKVNLKNGIANQSMQRAVFSRNVPDPNLSFLADASLAQEYASNYQPTTKTWRSPNMLHRPLYFEDANLERYGNGIGRWQPFASGIHFFSSVAFLPYKMGAHPMTECEYGMGYYRPGDCNPAYKQPIELSGRGALYQALGLGVIVGGL